MSKVASLDEAMALVSDGTELALCGFAISRNAVIAAAKLVELGRKRLRLVQVVGGIETDLLVGAGCVSALTYSGGSLDRFGPLHSVNRAISDGDLEVCEYSTLSLSLRLFAGSLDLPFIGTRTLLGSELLGDLVRSGGAVEMPDPFGGRPSVGLAPLRPEMAIVHVNFCDDDGNSVIRGPLWSSRETALAAKRVIVTAERVVRSGALDPSDVVVPGVTVVAVVQAPEGARPTSLWGEYDYDADVFADHVAASREGGVALATYLEKRHLSALP